MTHASLFSGIGGAELAASWLGWNNVFHCEIQEFQRKVLEYWFPNSISYEDITKTDFSQWRGKIDVLTGGFPCQPFSVAGKRKGAEDNRYLWSEMLRAIREIQPAWVVGENVNGLLSMVQPGNEVEVGRSDSLFEESYLTREEQEFTISRVCEDFEREGYSVQPLVIPACAVGAPHRRDRVWIVARAVKDTEHDGCIGRAFQGETQSQKRGQRMPRSRDSQRICFHTGSIANATDARAESVQQGWKDRISKSRTSPHSEIAGSERKLLCEQKEKQPYGQDSRDNVHDWHNFPTQSPVCSRDDGLPFRLANLTISFPKWRSKSIEALGNAWVPQVSYEIFKAIENYDNKVKID